MKYKVIRDCHFANRYWNEGTLAEFPESVVPNHHFELLNKQEGMYKKEVVVVNPDPLTMHEMNEQREKNKPTTGMAFNPGSDASVSKESIPGTPEIPHKGRGRPRSK